MGNVDPLPGQSVGHAGVVGARPVLADPLLEPAAGHVPTVLDLGLRGAVVTSVDVLDGCPDPGPPLLGGDLHAA